MNNASTTSTSDAGIGPTVHDAAGAVPDAIGKPEFR